MNQTTSNISKAAGTKVSTKSAQGNGWRKKNPRRYWAWTALANAKLRAEKKNVPFDLDVDYVESILPDKCPVFGEPFVFGSGVKRDPFTPTLDRIIPLRGYVKGNIQAISFKANLIKSAYGSTDVAVVAKWLSSEGH
jgi:hypothetical protein